MEVVEHPLSDHRISIIEFPSDENLFFLKCTCGEWEGKALKSGPTKLHPHRDEKAFAISTAERHILENKIWPYEKDGKPRRIIKEDGQSTVEILENWPYGEEDSI